MSPALIACVLFATPPRLELDKLPDPSTCSCTLRNAANEVLLFDEDLSAAHPRISVDGETLTLEQTRDTARKGYPRVGDAFFTEYRVADLTVRIDWVVTYVCAKNDESCEVTLFDATLKLHKGRTTRYFKRLKASCGC